MINMEEIFNSVEATCATVISIIILFFLTYIQTSCDCNNKFTATFLHILLYISVFAIPLCLLTKTVDIPIIALFGALVIFAQYIGELNRNKCKCLVEKPFLNTLLVLIKNLTYVAIVGYIIYMIYIINYMENKQNAQKLLLETIPNFLIKPIKFQAKENKVKSMWNWISKQLN